MLVVRICSLAALLFVVAYATSEASPGVVDDSHWRAVAAVSAASARLLGKQPLRKVGFGAVPPEMPRKWRGHVNQTVLVNGQVPPPTFGFAAPLPLMASDSEAKRMLTISDMELPFAPRDYVGTGMEWFNSTVFNTDNATFFEINGNKYYAGGNSPFNDMFAWVPMAKYSGQVAVKGEQLHRWTFSTDNQQMSSSFELLVHESGVPVRLTQNISSPQAVYNVTYKFESFDTGLGELERLWNTFDKSEYFTPMVCPAPSPLIAENVTMWIFHAKHVMDIVGQDLGNEAGDVVFVCQDVIANQSLATDHGYEWLTQWEIELVPRWGQYQNCNGHPPQCIGKENFWVGREHAEYMGLPAWQRQCGADNDLTGMWFSLPIGGQCKIGEHPGDGSCTWRIARRVKTIEGKCLFEKNGFKQACVAEQRSPFPKATQLFKDAFASEDPNRGGCPALSVASRDGHPAIVV